MTASFLLDLAERARAEISAERVLDWSAVNSGSQNLAGLSAMAELIGEALSALPGALQMLPGQDIAQIDGNGALRFSATGGSLRLSVRPEAPLQMLFTGHMDTVFDADHDFQKAWLSDDGVMLRGPGVADMKGGIAVMLAALVALERKGRPNRLGYEIIVNGDEEIGSHGSAALIAECARGKHAAFTFEPALPDGHLVSSRPGNGNFSIIVEGTAAHAGRNIGEGRNAVAAAADLALRLIDELGRCFPVNPSRIDGGAAFNTVPDRAVLRVNLRPATKADMDIASKTIRSLAGAVSDARGVKVSIHGSFSRPPKPMTAATERLLDIVKSCADDLCIDLGWRPSGGVCDGNNIAALNVPVVDTMGVVGGAIHTDQEYALCASLAERAGLAAMAIQRIADGDQTSSHNRIVA